MFKRRVILPFAGGLAETDHVLGHELVHAFQYDISAAEDVEGRPTGPGILSLPLWFIEGMAEYLSLGPVDANTAMWVRDATSREKMPTIKKLSDPDFFPYRYGHAFWSYVAGRWGDSAVGDMLRATGPGGRYRRRDRNGARDRRRDADQRLARRRRGRPTRRCSRPRGSPRRSRGR